MTKGESQALESQWRSHVEGWRTSGQTQKAYCQANNLIYHRLGYWHRKFNGAKERVSAPGFTRVSRQTSSPAAGLCICLPNGIELRGVDSDNLPVVHQLLSSLT